VNTPLLLGKCVGCLGQVYVKMIAGCFVKMEKQKDKVENPYSVTFLIRTPI
jgi:hypothetical protein